MMLNESSTTCNMLLRVQLLALLLVLALALLLTPELAQATPLNVPRSPHDTGAGMFLRMRPYDARIYGELPVDVVQKQRALVALTASSTSGSTFGSAWPTASMRAQLRQRTYEYRLALTAFMQRNVLQVLEEEFGFVVLGGASANRRDGSRGMASATARSTSTATSIVEPFWIDGSIYVRDGGRRATLSVMSERRPALFQVLRAHPHVLAVEPNAVVARIIDPVEQGEVVVVDDLAGKAYDNTNNATAWGVERVHAREAWQWTRGEGVLVATIDTGAMFAHSALSATYGGNSGDSSSDGTGSNATSIHDYNWFDPLEVRNDEWWCDEDSCSPWICCQDSPYDNVGHGTHVLGSIAGAGGLGVAPGARWMSAKGCRDGSCLRYGLTASAQWVVCPTRINGNEPDCSRGADIVSNSWGSQDPRDDFYRAYVEVWREAGQIPVFANGNNGPRCGAIGAPGDFKNVIGVGATNINDELAKFSSRGPGPVSKKHTPRGDNPTTEDPLYARQKPDISAPGVKIFSAYSMTNDSYTTMSGTSMATPHVSGVIALVMAALDQQAAAGVLSSSSDASQVAFRMSQSSQDAPPLSLYDTVYAILKDSAIRTGLGKPLGGGGARLPLPGWPVQEQCEHTGYQTWPNLFYGWGLLDAYAAVKLALERVVV